MKLEDLSIEQLKVLWFDENRKTVMHGQNRDIITQEILKREQAITRENETSQIVHSAE